MSPLRATAFDASGSTGTVRYNATPCAGGLESQVSALAAQVNVNPGQQITVTFPKVPPTVKPPFIASLAVIDTSNGDHKYCGYASGNSSTSSVINSTSFNYTVQPYNSTFGDVGDFFMFSIVPVVEHPTNTTVVPYWVSANYTITNSASTYSQYSSTSSASPRTSSCTKLGLATLALLLGSLLL